MAAVEQDADPGVVRLLDDVVRRASASRAFAAVERLGPVVHCTALTRPDAAFEAFKDADALYIAWVSADRYLSQSIEADLMWTGDDLNELIEEELAALGRSGEPLGRIEHFRDPQKRFTFRSRLPNAADADAITKALLAYAAAFANLGDMKPDDE